MFTIEEIMKNVPHRYPFLLIDRVLDFKANESVTTLKNVSINEAQFAGHFPGRPIYPGVYIVENQAQSACFLLAKSGGGLKENTVYYLGRINRMAFMRPVVPGDQLVTCVKIEKQLGANAMVSAESRVGDDVVARGDLMFAAAVADAGSQN
jgi:3-hydroxyacyl-[acyl-carrier-protein] dehydratase